MPVRTSGHWTSSTSGLVELAKSKFSWSPFNYNFKTVLTFIGGGGDTYICHNTSRRNRPSHNLQWNRTRQLCSSLQHQPSTQVAQNMTKHQANLHRTYTNAFKLFHLSGRQEGSTVSQKFIRNYGMNYSVIQIANYLNISRFQNLTIFEKQVKLISQLEIKL